MLLDLETRGRKEDGRDEMRVCFFEVIKVADFNMILHLRETKSQLL